jgi:hypothetical protein
MQHINNNRGQKNMTYLSDVIATLQTMPDQPVFWQVITQEHAGVKNADYWEDLVYKMQSNFADEASLIVRDIVNCNPEDNFEEEPEE